MKPEIIITARGHAGTMATLQSEFTTHLLSEASDRNAFLKQHAPKVRGLATFGPMPVDGKLMDALPKLEIIANFGVGVDAINLDDAKKRNIIVTNTPDVLNEAVADTAMALVLMTVRKYPQSEVYLRAGNWASRGPYPLTIDIGGKTLGILGLGRIGEAIARRATACGMVIRYHNRNRKDVPYPYDPDPVTLAKNSDVLMVVTPATAETARIINATHARCAGPRRLSRQHRAGLGGRRAGAAALPAGKEDCRRRPRCIRRRAARAGRILHPRQRGAAAARRQRHRRDEKGDGRPADR